MLINKLVKHLKCKMRYPLNEFKIERFLDYIEKELKKLIGPSDGLFNELNIKKLMEKIKIMKLMM